MNTRRDFLKFSAAVTAAGWCGFPERRSLAADNAAEVIPGKHAGLIVHGAMPAEIETPLKLLRDHRLTPKELLFVRNNQTLTGSLTLEPGKLEGWKIELSGLLNRPAMFDAAAL